MCRVFYFGLCRVVVLTACARRGVDEHVIAAARTAASDHRSSQGGVYEAMTWGYVPQRDRDSE
ncbi:hypothetical protein ABZ801_18530 [Actinomadura sp. NPDC047616]|uniref:hypothetical protein n=1 Tax=Actinomadura sp. NPDC047616 TaxID=3155914 RepID=UPI0034037BFA